MRLLRVEDLFRFLVRTGKCYFVRLYFDIGRVACRHADVAAWILDLHRRTRRNRHVQDLLIQIVFRLPEHVEEVVPVMVTPIASPWAPYPTRRARSKESNHGKQDQDA